MFADALYQTCMQAGLCTASTVWAAAQESYLIIRSGVERAYPGIDETGVIAVCVIITALVISILWVLSPILGAIGLGLGVFVLGCGLIVHQDRSIRVLKEAAESMQAFFKDTVNGFCSIIGDRQELIDTLRENSLTQTGLKKTIEDQREELKELKNSVGELTATVHAIYGAVMNMRNNLALIELSNEVQKLFGEMERHFKATEGNVMQGILSFSQKIDVLGEGQMGLFVCLSDLLEISRETNRNVKKIRSEQRKLSPALNCLLSNPVK